MITIKCIMFLMGHVLFLAGIEANPNILETTIITETDEEISLRWVQTENILANGNLPVWRTTDSSEMLELDLNVMRSVGPFNMYYDVEKSSAVVHFLQANCIRGVIGLKYFINCLPYDQVSGYRHKVGVSRYLTIVDAQELSNFAGLTERSDNEHMPHKCDMKFPITHENRPYYPEILIFISNEIVTQVIPNGVQEPDYNVKLSALVMQYIVQFNAVAMLFAKLESKGIKIHINIASLIIEKNRNQLPFINSFGNYHPRGEFVLSAMVEYIKNLKQNGRQKLFVDDSFDMFLLSTVKPWQERAMNPGGISTPVFDVLHKRRLRTNIRDKSYLGSIVNGRDFMLRYDYAAREIAHLMKVRDDATHNNLFCNGVQCHAIMQDSQYRPNSLSWSRESIQNFEHYFKYDKNACFLRNVPRSLYPFGDPVESSTPVEQCRCYGHDSSLEMHYIEITDGGSCKKALRCQQTTPYRIFPTSPPVDGTPCKGNNMEGVCWRGNCVLAHHRRY